VPELLSIRLMSPLLYSLSLPLSTIISLFSCSPTTLLVQLYPSQPTPSPGLRTLPSKIHNNPLSPIIQEARLSLKRNGLFPLTLAVTVVRLFFPSTFHLVFLYLYHSGEFSSPRGLPHHHPIRLKRYYRRASGWFR
jgi:hypothetical protein